MEKNRRAKNANNENEQECAKQKTFKHINQYD
jgi:hypothetical protein